MEYNEDDSHEDRLNTCAGAACYLLHICAVPCSLLLGIGDMGWRDGGSEFNLT